VPFDPAITVHGRLPCGMRYWIRPHKKPRGSVSLVLNVASGSVEETRGQRGLAHFLEHVAFKGGKHFPPGTLIPYFASQGISFGVHQNAHTSYAHTAYELQMPTYEPASFHRALEFMSDVARDLVIPPKEVAKEKPVVLEEFRYRGGVSGRLWHKSAGLLLKGSRYALREPIGLKADVRAATAKELRAYYETWYRPERTTLVVVGDVDAAVVEKDVKEVFGDWKARAQPAPRVHLGRLVTQGLRVGAFDDPDQHRTDVMVTHCRRPLSWKTFGDLKRRLVENLAIRMMNARLEYLRRAKSALYGYAWMREREVVPGLEAIECGVSGREGRWIGCMREVLHEVVRAQKYGFDQEELDRVRSDILAQYDTLEDPPSAQIARHLQEALAEERAPISPRTWERVTRACFPQIAVRDVTAAFRAMMDLDDAAIVLELPQKDRTQDLPTQPEVLDYYQEARHDRLHTWSERNESLVVRSVLEKDPKPGEVASRSTNADLHVTSLRLENGVRVNLRRLQTPGRVHVRVALLGGRVEETAKTHGLTDLAFGALHWGGVCSEDVDPDTATRYLLTRQADVGCDFGPARITYDVRASKHDLPDAMRLLWLVLAKPHVHYDSLREARARAWGWRWGQKHDVGETADFTLERELAGEDPRWDAPDGETYAKLDEKAVEAWLGRIVHTAPMEVAIVGDIEPKAGEELARRWFGSLPARKDRRKELEKLRHAATWSGPKREDVNVESNDPGAVVVLAWRGVGRLDEARRAALDHAASLIDARLFDDLRSKHGLSYDVSASYVDEDVDGLSHLEVRLTTDPAKAKEAADVARKVVEKFAQEGPTDKELTTVAKQWRALLDLGDERPERWLGTLTRLDLAGRTLDGLRARRAAWRTSDGALIRKTIVQVVQPSRFCRVIALPVPPKKK
jgi:zinc protease